MNLINSCCTKKSYFNNRICQNLSCFSTKISKIKIFPEIFLLQTIMESTLLQEQLSQPVLSLRLDCLNFKKSQKNSKKKRLRLSKIHNFFLQKAGCGSLSNDYQNRVSRLNTT